ncbi:MAG: hypothetical protein KME11_16885 [Timaviella obliquedivisa GSE-PSE-MK23-08B]|nr:hypothetical protein [Timaviella obliquedivisa GSE-PSE-MK23-08B]
MTILLAETQRLKPPRSPTEFLTVAHLLTAWQAHPTTLQNDADTKAPAQTHSKITIEQAASITN